MRIIDSLLGEVDQEAKTTRRVLEKIPEDKLGWKAHAKSMSLGQLGLHIAALNEAIARLAEADTTELPQFKQAQAATKAEILDTFDKGLANAKQMLNRVDDTRALGMWSMTKNGATVLTMPRVALYRAIMCNHQYHHRGQLSVYLRLLDVPVPSIYGPSADENPF